MASQPRQMRQAPEAPRPVATNTEEVKMSDSDRDFYSKQRRSRSIAMALALGAVVIVFYVVSLVQGPGIISRPY
ncbi:MAG: hypothetical protein RIC24_00645 [Hyphomicrobiales bacterium]|jgi:hypothetical protein